jgi:hypothetical protein
MGVRFLIAAVVFSGVAGGEARRHSPDVAPIAANRCQSVTGRARRVMAFRTYQETRP